MSKEIFSIPAITLRGVVVFPDMNMSFDVDRQKSVSAIKEVLNNNVTACYVNEQSLLQG